MFTFELIKICGPYSDSYSLTVANQLIFLWDEILWTYELQTELQVAPSRRNFWSSQPVSLNLLNSEVNILDFTFPNRLLNARRSVIMTM